MLARVSALSNSLLATALGLKRRIEGAPAETVSIRMTWDMKNGLSARSHRVHSIQGPIAPAQLFGVGYSSPVPTS